MKARDKQASLDPESCFHLPALCPFCSSQDKGRPLRLNPQNTFALLPYFLNKYLHSDSAVSDTILRDLQERGWLMDPHGNLTSKELLPSPTWADEETEARGVK